MAGRFAADVGRQLEAIDPATLVQRLLSGNPAEPALRACPESPIAAIFAWNTAQR